MPRKYSGPYQYNLLLTTNPITKKVTVKKKQDGKYVNFQSPVTSKKRPKIYILKDAESIIYVGYAGQPIGTRIWQGLYAQGLNGYHGYKWKQEEQLELSVFVFEEAFCGIDTKDAAYKSYVEAIEAELVYLIRHKTGQWPKYQHEIHFNNYHGLAAIKCAEAMFKHFSDD